MFSTDNKNLAFIVSIRANRSEVITIARIVEISIVANPLLQHGIREIFLLFLLKRVDVTVLSIFSLQIVRGNYQTLLPARNAINLLA